MQASNTTPALTGPQAIAEALGRLNLENMEAEAKEIIRTRKVSKRPRAVAVLNVLEGMKRNQLQPKDLMITAVPVIPPVFRPYSVLGTTFVPGDANELYRDLMQLRDAHKEAESILGPSGASESRLALYDAVKAVTGFGDPVVPKTKQRGVSGFLKQITGTSPKFSFPMRKMLGKPQDSTGRGVIVVNPDLGLDEIGIPYNQAWTYYAPYIQRNLVTSGMSPADALRNVKERSQHALRALQQEVERRPVIYSRAPAWHKYNTLAARPRLIEGDSIEITPLTTAGQGADFDGDTVNIHVPASDEAVAEAYEKLLPSKMLFSIRDPDKVIPVPKHEMILSLYAANRRPAQAVHYFDTEEQALDAIRKQQVPLRDEVIIGPRPPEVPAPEIAEPPAVPTLASEDQIQ